MDADTTDEKLMQAYVDNDPAAFDALYSRHKGGIYRYFLRQCSDEATAQELFQDVWMKLIHSKQRYQPTAKFSTWLYTLAHHRLVDWYRKQNVSMSVDDKQSDPQSQPATADWQPENELARLRLVKALQTAITLLPAEQREVFLLHEEGGFTVAEIAEITGVSKEATKSRYRYAVQKLRARLEAVR
ncbi:MAG TPA: RNA polymerase sigma factor [Chromatiales bacterium]|nr:RNA polymerase sigma factor [Thiotrichales bacterium]HIP68426.1 RNA polymerase sigma factor [Chromatiales bacterium]